MVSPGTCSHPGCENAADPRWFVHIGGNPYPACDGHGCNSGAPCYECAHVAAAQAAQTEAEKQLAIMRAEWEALIYPGHHECPDTPGPCRYIDSGREACDARKRALSTPPTVIDNVLRFARIAASSGANALIGLGAALDKAGVR